MDPGLLEYDAVSLAQQFRKFRSHFILQNVGNHSSPSDTMLYDRRSQISRNKALRTSNHETLGATIFFDEVRKLGPQTGSRVLHYSQTGNPKVIKFFQFNLSPESNCMSFRCNITLVDMHQKLNKYMLLYINGILVKHSSVFLHLTTARAVHFWL